MLYREIPRTKDKVSVIGMGASVIGERPENEIIKTVRAACENGINYFDMAGGHASIFPAYGKALEGIREKVMLQIHFGADYTSGEYGWTTDPDEIKKSVKWQLENLKTDYIDYGFIHCLDEEPDLRACLENGVLDYIKELKNAGIVRHIGLSSHSPRLVNKVLDMNIIDVVMFSVNPGYDYGEGEFSIGNTRERQELYCRCQREGVGITVMKPFCGGQLLDAKQSPFGVALTTTKCIQYALDKPGVVTVLPGFGNEKELEETLKFLTASESERDYSGISKFVPKDSAGKCVWCRHCHPCPAGLDIALINKYYDLSRLGDSLAKEHYLTLEKKASDCISCGHCDERCPFHVAQSGRMEKIKEYFGI